MLTITGYAENSQSGVRLRVRKTPNIRQQIKIALRQLRQVDPNNDEIDYALDYLVRGNCYENEDLDVLDSLREELRRVA